MVRLLAEVWVLAISGCATLEPELFRMRDFGEQFDPTVHGTVGSNEGAIIIYRDPALDERIKFMVSAGVDERDGTDLGYTSLVRSTDEAWPGAELASLRETVHE